MQCKNCGAFAYVILLLLLPLPVTQFRKFLLALVFKDPEYLLFFQ